MICPRCGFNCLENDVFCENCGCNLKKEINENSCVEKKRFKINIKILIVCIFFIVILSVIVLFCLNNNKKNEKTEKDETVKEQTTDNESSNNLKLTSYEKILSDYNNNKIDINEYFTQLVYLNYDCDKVDKKYKSNIENYTTNDMSLMDILDKNEDKIDKDIIKYYLENEVLSNVKIKADSSGISETNEVEDSEAKFMDDSSQSNALNHTLNKAKLSSNQRFILWYASSGDDKITDDQADLILNNLESSVDIYEQKFGITYTHSPYVDKRGDEDEYDNAAELLESSDIPEKYLKSAMSIYVYDTGSEDVLASYRDEQKVKKQIDKVLTFALDDGIISYPYIVINRKGLKSNDTLIEVTNHELFHHMQFLYCKQLDKTGCLDNLLISEATANYASSITSEVTSTSSFLNTWAGRYVKNLSTDISKIANPSGNVGYAIFPYLYSYFNIVNNGYKTIMESHLKDSPMEYINNNTTKEDLIRVINDVAYSNLIENYDMKTLVPSEKIVYGTILKKNKSYDKTIEPGAVNYYLLDKGFKIITSLDDSEYLTFSVYGEKEGVYTKIKEVHSNFELDCSTYSVYNKLYFVVTNANLVKSSDYSFSIDDVDYVENDTYKTDIKNYKIDMTMNIGINQNGLSVVTTNKSIGIVDEYHQKQYLETETSSMGMVVSSITSYSDYNSGITYTSVPYSEDDSWVKDSSSSQLINLKNILIKLNSMSDVTKIADNHFKIKMDAKDIESLGSISSVNTKSIKNITVDVYTKDDYITRMEYDFSNLIPEISTFKVVMNFSDYNNAGSVNIPTTVAKIAKNR